MFKVTYIEGELTFHVEKLKLVEKLKKKIPVTDVLEIS